MISLYLLLTAVEGDDFMSKFIPGNQKHLTLEDRIFIENSFKSAAFFQGHR